MKPMFNKRKVKSWIRKVHNEQLFGYGHGYITDGRIMLVEEDHMRPAILELFGTLEPECRYTSEMLQEMITLPHEPVEVVDSRLELVLGPKSRLRIFYDPATGKELTINTAYFELINEPLNHRFYVDESMTRVWITHGATPVGVVAAVRLQDQVAHINFKKTGGENDEN